MNNAALLFRLGKCSRDTVCVGSDGLRYCKVCGEAKEAFFPEGGFMGMKKHSRQCACDRKAYEEEQKYKERIL